MTPEYKTTCEQIDSIIKESGLPEMQKYSLLTTCLSKVAHEYNNSDFATMKVKLALLCKTMLDAVEKAEQLYNKLKK